MCFSHKLHRSQMRGVRKRGPPNSGAQLKVNSHSVSMPHRVNTGTLVVPAS